MSRRPSIFQYGAISNGAISFTNSKPTNRIISGTSRIEIADSLDVASPDMLIISKRGQTGYIELTNTTNTIQSLSVSSNGCTINKAIILQDGANKTTLSQVGSVMSLTSTGTVNFGTNISTPQLLTNSVF